MSKIPSPDKHAGSKSHLAALALTLASAAIVVTCGASRTEPPASAQATKPSAPSASIAPLASAPPLSPSLSSSPPLASASAEAPDASASVEEPEGPLPRGPGHELDNFFAALRGLEQKKRKSHVRVAWLGDSHGAADFWSGTFRTALQKRFGNAGPGFVHLGYKAYRHDGIKTTFGGEWRTRPAAPSTMSRTGDGIHGLGGIMGIAKDKTPRTTITVSDASGPYAWDICYRFPTRDDALVLKQGEDQKTELRQPQGEALGAIRHHLLRSADGSPSLALVAASGHPELCGVVIETDPATSPGVVLDTLGINGARLGTPLAWDEASWIAELSRRAPSLVVVEYGTNESGDLKIDPSVYIERLARLMERVHKASPSCDCIVLAPTDRADTEERTPLVRDALKSAAKASSCAFWDTYQNMGGKGSIRAFRAEKPPRAAPDGVHLTQRGYRELGEKLSDFVLKLYDR